MTPFYWIMVRQANDRAHANNPGYYVDRATGRAKVDELNAKAGALGGKVRYDLRSGRAWTTPYVRPRGILAKLTED